MDAFFVRHESRLLLRWALVLTVALVVQIGILRDLRIAEVHPDLMLLVAVASGLTAGPARGAAIGFSAGILADLFLSNRFGVTALALAVTGYFAGVAGDTVVRPARWITVTLTVLASAMGLLLYAVLGQLLGEGSLGDPRLGAIVGIVSITNGLLALPAQAVTRWAESDNRLRRR